MERASHMKGALVASYAFAVAMLGVTLPTPLYTQYQHRLGFSTLTGIVTAVIVAALAATCVISLVALRRR